ncbi:unnamed protein product [Allacma fusca]|uniref:Uncharacterized protein n=1 Tax=Allacma fusca TaxID=39272 RepID=A0A8J2PM20_9HEXA|nr:unnamed protein product [Allacma fusca]
MCGVIGLFRVLFKSPTTPKKPSKQTEVLTISERFRNYFTLPYETAEMLFHVVRGRKIGRRFGDSNMCCSMSSNISEELIESTRNMHNVDYSSVVFSAILGAVARALKSSGREPPVTLDLGYVFPMQEHPGGWQSQHLNILFEEFPCKANSSQERLLEIQRVFNKDRTLLVSTLFFYRRVLAMLPSRILRPMTQFVLKLGPSFIMSNFDVQLSKEYVDGLEVVDIFTGVSLSTALGMLITSWGVSGQQRFNFHLDKYIFGDETSAMKLATYFEEELEALQTLERSPLDFRQMYMIPCFTDLLREL